MNQDTRDTPSAAGQPPPVETSKPEADAKPARRRRWLRRLGIAAVVAVVLYAVGGFFGAPLVVRHAVLPRVAERVNGELAVGGIGCNPFALSLSLREIVVAEASGDEALRVARASGDFDLWRTLFNRGWWFAHLRLTEPVVHASVGEDGSINLLSLIVPPDDEPSDEPFEVPRVVIRDLSVASAEVHVRDAMTDPDYEQSITGIDFVIDELDTRPDHANVHTMSATFGGGAAVTWEGRTFVDPLTKFGKLTVEGVRLENFTPYALLYAGMAIDGGVVDLEIDYALRPFHGEEALSIDDTRVAVRGLAIAADGRPLLEVGSFEATGLHAGVDDGRVHADRVSVSGLVADVRREEDGGFEVVRLLERAARSPMPATAPDRAASRLAAASSRHPVELVIEAIYRVFADVDVAWRASIDGFAVADSVVRFDDRSTPTPVSVEWDDIAITVGELANASGVVTPFTFSVAGPRGATVALEGEVAVIDRRLAADVSVSGLALADASPYLPRDLPEPLAGVELAAGFVDVEGRLEAESDAERFTAAWDGGSTLRDVATTGPGDDPPLTLGSLSTRGALAADAAFDGPALHATWRGTLDLAGFAASGAMGEASAAVGVEALAVESDVESGFADGAVSASWEGVASVSGFTARGRMPDALVDLGLADGRVTQGSLTYRDGRVIVEADEVALVAPRATAELPASLRLGGLEPIDLEEEEPADVDAVAEAAPPAADASEPGGEPSGEPPAPPSVELPFDLKVKRFVVTGAEFDVVETGAFGDVTLAGREGSITLDHIDTTTAEPSTVSVSSRLLDAGRVTVTGDAKPFAPLPYLDLEVRLDDLPLRPLSPAVEPQLGFTIDRGRLSLGLPVKVENNRLDGRLDARFRSFYLGEKVDAPNAPNLPLRLGLDLLRDRDDVVRIEVGLSGDTTDPSFSFRKLIWRAVFKTVSGAVASPFNVIARAVGGGRDADLSSVGFVPGLDEPAEGAAESIDLLASALRERPQLRLLVVGLTGPADEAALRVAAVDARVAERLGSLIEAGDAEGADDPAGVEAALRAVYEARFPAGERRAVPVPPGRFDQDTPEPAAMRRRLAASIAAPPDELAALAVARAERVAAMLTDGGGLAASRVSIAEGGDASSAVAREPSPAVAFELLAGPPPPEPAADAEPPDQDDDAADPDGAAD